MSYIIPNTTLQVYGDVGLSNSHEDTLYFASEAAKNNYFGGVGTPSVAPAYTFSNMYYNRENRGQIRVGAPDGHIVMPIKDLYNMRYMRYKNTAFENKWFYAFITSVDYINNETVEITFESDVIMTWMGNFTISKCYVERCHAANDAIGANICSENLPVGPYVCENEGGTGSKTGKFNTYSVGFYKVYNPDKDGTDNVAGVSQGIYIPLIATFYLLETTVLAALSNRIADLVQDNRGEEIVNMKLIPSFWADLTDVNAPKTYVHDIAKPYSTVAGYGPVRNNKLFCYPYKYLSVENSEGIANSYMYEFFNTLPDDTSSGNASFTIQGTACTPEVSIMCTPRNYKGEAQAYSEALSMNNFPSIAWNIDGYRAYIAQRDSTLFGDVVTGTAANAAGGAMGGGLVGAALGALKGIIGGAMAPVSDALNNVANDMIGTPTRYPEELKGNPSSNIMAQSRTKDFYFRQMSITKNYAKMIDDFFDVYGYAVRQHITPRMKVRHSWTYIKTVSSIVNGSMPASDAREIEQMLDRGIRFWVPGRTIGDYTQDNYVEVS